MAIVLSDESFKLLKTIRTTKFVMVRTVRYGHPYDIQSWQPNAHHPMAKILMAIVRSFLISTPITMQTPINVV